MALSPPKLPGAAAAVSDGDSIAVQAGAPNDDNLALLQNQTIVLENLLRRVQKLRDTPARVLAGAMSQLSTASTGLTIQALGADISTHAANAFAELRAVESQLREDAIQTALAAAKAQNHSGQNLHTLKRKREPDDQTHTPVHPAPPRSNIEPANAAAGGLPLEDPGRVKVTQTSLPSFIRDHNKARPDLKLHIWSADRGQQKRRPSTVVVIRVTVPGVLVAYVTFEDIGPELVAEAVAVFGPKERKPVYSQSEYSVFQKVSQHILSIVRQAGDVSLQRIIEIFHAYSEVFQAQCTRCSRVVSETDHLPAVEISWRAGTKLRFHSTC
ncbi:hypothetical protein AURDEDRAFT_149333 [Auricularia subglabra TFB-10046 SS5]|nr:hypothetical protein AURDEDRAFT_149333 [Auricularia subglabra TFB-10046 SS5]